MTQKQLLIMGVIVLALAGIGAWWQMNQTQTSPMTSKNNNTETAETYDPRVLGTQAGVDSVIDSEADRIDLEIKSKNESDFSTSGISGEQLGL